mmetsp:Transcript_69383/g.166360  ORF Transcript_69383/g.166360 Transcript_69383/m.166360 type:complete len:253 (+) Transcript_69383:1129-1887(+)
MSKSNSWLLMARSLFRSWHSSNSSSVLFRNCTAACSRSASATELTTPHKMPMSMFKMVKLLKKMKTKKRKTSKPLSWPIKSSFSAGESKSVPCSSNSIIASGTVGIISANLASSPACILKMTPNKKRSMNSNIKVTNTDRVAAAIPFNNVITSGTTRTSLAILPRRVRRTKRAALNASRPAAGASPPGLFTSKSAIGSAQVSAIMRMSKTESKTNQKSCMQFFFSLKAPKRIISSMLKNTQKQLSITTASMD